MTATTWPDGDGVLDLPDGRRVRGRGLRQQPPPGPLPQFGLFLLSKPPHDRVWLSRWVQWRDYWLPSDKADAREAITDAFERAATQRVEVSCDGGKGRTGTALACLCVLAGMTPKEAIAYVRQNYHRRAVETPWQRRFVTKFAKTNPAA